MLNLPCLPGSSGSCVVAVEEYRPVFEFLTASELIPFDNHCLQFTLALYAISANSLVMNSKHKKTLSIVLAKPATGSLDWAHIETLFNALGAQTIKGNGSRVRSILNNVVSTFHRPHSAKEAKPYQVIDVRRFLEQAGIRP